MASIVPRRRPSPLFALLLCNLPLIASAAPSSPDALGRFHAEYPAAAARLEEAFKRARGEASVTRVIDKARFDYKVNFAIDGDLRKVMVMPAESVGQPRSPDAVHCIGSKSVFSLRRSDARAKYAITSMGRQANTVDTITYFNDMAGRFVYSPSTFSGTPLKKFMSHPSFKMLEAVEEVVDGEKTIKVKYYYNPSGSPVTDTIVFLPDRGWVISRASRDSPVKGLRFSYEVEYQGGGDSPAVPSSLSFADSDTQSTRARFNSLVLGEATPPREFDLPFFGLPEIDVVPASARGDRTTLWVGSLGVLAFIGAVALRRSQSKE